MTEFTPARRRLILLMTSIGSIMNPFLGTMIILAMPTIGVEFTVSAHDLGWLSTAFILANAIMLVPASWIVDKIGYKKCYFFGSLLVGISSILSIFSPSYGFLITFRILAGLGISFVMITSMAILTRIFPRDRRGFVIGINTTMIYVGLTLGPFLGGILCDAFGWQSIFIAIAPFITLSGILVFCLMKTEFTEPVSRFDKIGALLYATATFCLMYGLSTITEPMSVVLAAVGLILFILFIRYEIKQEAPVLHIRQFITNKRFARSSYAALLNYAASYAVIYMLSLYLQSIGQLTATEAGVILLVQTLIQAIFTPITGKLSDKMDPKYLVTVGMIMTMAGLILLANLGLRPDFHGYILVVQILMGMGTALFSAPNSASIMNSVPKKEHSSASSIIALVRQFGMLISMAICMSSIAFFVGNSEMLTEAMFPGFAMALNVAMYICAGLSLIGVLCSWFRGPKPTFDEDE